MTLERRCMDVGTTLERRHNNVVTTSFWYVPAGMSYFAVLPVRFWYLPGIKRTYIYEITR